VLNRSKAGAVALLIVVFAVGAIVGWSGRGSVDRSPPRYSNSRAMVAYLTKQLTLTPLQQESIRVMLRRHRADVDTVLQRVRPRFDSLRATMQGEIAAQLTPTQQGRFRELIAEFDRQRHIRDSLRRQQ
jgi:hypothetical protein